jgi:hypothetical protein
MFLRSCCVFRSTWALVPTTRHPFRRREPIEDPNRAQPPSTHGGTAAILFLKFVQSAPAFAVPLALKKPVGEKPATSWTRK